MIEKYTKLINKINTIFQKVVDSNSSFEINGVKYHPRSISFYKSGCGTCNYNYPMKLPNLEGIAFIKDEGMFEFNALLKTSCFMPCRCDLDGLTDENNKPEVLVLFHSYFRNRKCFEQEFITHDSIILS